jgi:hypothetical protein
MNAFHSAVAAARTVADLEEVVQGAIGSSHLMEFVRFEAGDFLRKEPGATTCTPRLIPFPQFVLMRARRASSEQEAPITASIAALACLKCPDRATSNSMPYRCVRRRSK